MSLGEVKETSVSVFVGVRGNRISSCSVWMHSHPSHLCMPHLPIVRNGAEPVPETTRKIRTSTFTPSTVVWIHRERHEHRSVENPWRMTSRARHRLNRVNSQPSPKCALLCRCRLRSLASSWMYRTYFRLAPSASTLRPFHNADN